MAKTKIETNVEFGKKYRDKITGLEGIAISISKYQYGCLRVGLQPKAKDDGTVPDAVWFDEESIEKIEPIEKKTGGPQISPKRNSDPKRY
uniref:Uncharacterized protein n=1 Tax=viral metagenome TaxID=1070528 RepID=A0A6M3KEQ4_9ZZZZ